MPKVSDHSRQQELPAEEILPYLLSHDIHYEFLPVERAAAELRQKSVLTEAEQKDLLEAFSDEIERLSKQHHFISHDLVVLNEESTPNLRELLGNFERVHQHAEDEVRFIVDGEGIFTLTRGDDTFSVTVTPGDLIFVPAGTEHYFTLTETRNVKAIRLFQTKDGWVAIYKEDPSGETR